MCSDVFFSVVRCVFGVIFSQIGKSMHVFAIFDVFLACAYIGGDVKLPALPTAAKTAQISLDFREVDCYKGNKKRSFR
ncbi:MAG: hypothetical protein ACI4RV_05345, partial [Eubacteriales bacterium]